MARRTRPVAAVLLVILLAHLALMASPLHASGGHHGGAGDAGHSEHAGHSTGAAAAGPAHPDAGGDRFATGSDRPLALAGVHGAESHARGMLTWPEHAERFEDCALTPGPATKRWGLDLGVLRAAPLAPLVVPAPAGAPPTPAPPRPPPAAQLAFLQTFRN